MFSMHYMQGACAEGINFYNETMRVMRNVLFRRRLVRMMLFELSMLPCMNNECGCQLHLILASRDACF